MKHYLPHILALVAIAIILIFVVAPRTSKNGLETAPRVEEPKLIAPPPLPTGVPSFEKSHQFMSKHTYSIDAGDLNNDGYADIVTGNYNNENIIYFNNKDGTFMPSPVLAGAKFTAAIAMSDLNGDGWKDVVELNDNAASIAWINNKDGTFTPKPIAGTERLHSCCTYTAGTTSISNPASAIAFADFNGDGKQDIFLPSDRKVLLLLGDGTGNFNPQEVPGIQHTTALAAGDLNKDGKIDLVIGTDFSKNYVLINNGDGTFTRSTLPDDLYHTTSVALADMDKDGDLDIVVGNNNQPDLIYYNDEGAFRLTVLDPETKNTYELAAADLNNDGNQDIIVGNYNQESYYYLNKGDGTFDKRQFSIAGYIRSLTTADVDNDKDVDIIVARDNQPSEVYINELK